MTTTASCRASRCCAGRLRQEGRSTAAAAAGRSRRRRRAAESVPLTQDLVGRVSAFRTADVRARVAGVLQKRVYTRRQRRQGRPAAVRDRSGAAAGGAERAAKRRSRRRRRPTRTTISPPTRARLGRRKNFSRRRIVDNAEAAERTAAASVKQAQANVDSARINLGYANVARADRRPRRPAAGHRRRAGRPGRGDAADHDRPDRSGLRELQQA